MVFEIAQKRLKIESSIILLTIILVPYCFQRHISLLKVILTVDFYCMIIAVKWSKMPLEVTFESFLYHFMI